MIFSTFESARLHFRPIGPTDEAFIFEIRTDARVATFLDRKLIAEVGEARAFIQKRMLENASGDCFYWAMDLKNDGSTVGTICLWNFADDRKMAEIGYELLPRFWRKGLAEEAVRRVLEVAFESLGLLKITAFSNAENAPSVFLLEKTGFKIDLTLAEEPPLLAFSILENSKPFY